jgi:hypothetical protein
MASTAGQFATLKANNPAKRLGLFRDTTGADNNRVIIYGLASSVTSQTIVGTGLILTGIEWQKAVYTTETSNRRYYPKPITVTVV